MSPKRAAATRFVLGRALLLTLAACCVLIPVTVAALNGFFPGLGQHAAQPEPLTTLPAVPAHGYRAVPASGTIFGHLGGSGLALLIGAAFVIVAALTVRALRRRRRG